MKILSLDTETTGLENPFDDDKGAKLIQFACVPAEITKDGYFIRHDIIFDVFIKCPSFETMLPNLNPWIVEHNKNLIQTAHSTGLKTEEFALKFKTYLDTDIKNFTNGEKFLVLGKSLPSLDFLLMIKNLGYDFMREYGFLRNYLDINPIIEYLEMKNQINISDASSKTLMKYFGFGEDVNHTACSDAIDMIKIYSEMLKI